MAHLTSRHSLTIPLSNSAPTQDDIYTHMVAIQGPTDVKFTIHDIDLGSLGASSFVFDYGDGSAKRVINPTFSNGLPVNLPRGDIEHTYYQTTTTASEITATATIRYFSNNSSKPLSAVHNIIIKQTAQNIIEKNFEIINNQLFTIAGSAIPIFNLESDENTVYPSAFTEIETPILFDDNIYINTNPETNINLSDTYLYRTLIELGSDITTAGVSALSGSGFTLQGKSGKLYTVAFSTSGNDLRYTYTQNTTSILLSSLLDYTPTQQSVQSAIIDLFTSNNLLDVEFSAISAVNNNSLVFFQSSQLPPEATINTYTTTTSTTSSGSENNYTAFTFTDETYSYISNAHGDAGLTGLSAVNRMKTDKDALLIRAL